MESGDYAFGELGVERKTVSDFLGSLYKRRLYEQLFNLKENYANPKLAVIGEIPPTHKWVRFKRKRIPIKLTQEEMDQKEKLIINNWAVIDRSLHVDVLRFDTTKQFVMYLVALFMNTNEKERRFKPVKRKKATIEEIQEEILTCLPRWGRKTAKRMIKDYSSLWKIIEEDPKILKKKINKPQMKVLLRVFKDI